MSCSRSSSVLNSAVVPSRNLIWISRLSPSEVGGFPEPGYGLWTSSCRRVCVEVDIKMRSSLFQNGIIKLGWFSVPGLGIPPSATAGVETRTQYLETISLSIHENPEFRIVYYLKLELPRILTSASLLVTLFSLISNNKKSNCRCK